MSRKIYLQYYYFTEQYAHKTKFQIDSRKISDREGEMSNPGWRGSRRRLRCTATFPQKLYDADTAILEYYSFQQY